MTYETPDTLVCSTATLPNSAPTTPGGPDRWYQSGPPGLGFRARAEALVERSWPYSSEPSVTSKVSTCSPRTTLIVVDVPAASARTWAVMSVALVIGRSLK